MVKKVIKLPIIRMATELNVNRSSIVKLYNALCEEFIYKMPGRFKQKITISDIDEEIINSKTYSCKIAKSLKKNNEETFCSINFILKGEKCYLNIPLSTYRRILG
jgi:hypothetical protein